MKILLLFPPITVYRQSVKKCDVPLGMAYIAAYLEKNGHKVSVIDISLEGYDNERVHGSRVTFGLEDRDIKERIRSISPDLIGVSCSYSLQLDNAIHVSKLAKEAVDAPVLIGGVHPTFDAENILRTVNTIDYVALGEGEETFLDLANGKPLSEIEGISYKRSNEVIINRERDLINNIDALPFPARHLFNMEKYIKINKPHNHFPQKNRVASIITSRGCFAKCTFCSSSAFWRNELRVRAVDNVIEEMKILVDKYDIQEIQILDDNLTGMRGRAKELFKKMKGLDIVWCTPNGVRIDTIDEEMLALMKQSGCYRLTYAVESGNQDILDNVIKKPLRLEKVKPIVDMTKKFNIGVHTYWIIGFPGETRKQMIMTYDFAKSLRTESSSFCLAMPMIGTELLEMCKKNDLLREGFIQTEVNCNQTEIKNPSVPKAELEKMCDTFNDRINRGLLWRQPISFFKKYYKEILRNPSRITKIFKKFT